MFSSIPDHLYFPFRLPSVFHLCDADECECASMMCYCFRSTTDPLFEIQPLLLDACKLRCEARHSSVMRMDLNRNFQTHNRDITRAG